MTSPHLDEEPPEHRRYAAYLEVLDTATEANETELVTAVLGDEDAIMAQAAVVAHINRRACQLLTDSRFAVWADSIAAVIMEWEFLTRRLHEWSLIRRIALGQPWDREEVITASDWCQRAATTVPAVTSPQALALFADHGRTRRVRNAATLRLRNLEQSN
ncbi:hypothetical protein [Nocardiopsis lucentensis]|uniref:hypothetical protein n=1 Tax=Nocardiopsis lucentensis TaxID=53441 RepID=UPI000368D60C|nr:hypothetical protein [Nocardiopsis lucentensis]